MKISGSSVPAYNDGFSQASEMLRLHLNENPFGPPQSAMRAARELLESGLCVYPDSETAELRAKIAGHAGVTPDMVVVGNGVDELVLMTVLAAAGADGTVLTTRSTFPGYLSAAAVCGAAVREIDSGPRGIDADAVVDAVARHPSDLLFVCNPHNPTGTLLGRADITRIADAAERTGTLAVFDEAYMDFVADDGASALGLVRSGRRAMVLRTFSKAWGLAAVRVGYAIGPADVAARVRQSRQAVPFSANRPGQAAALRALDDPGHLVEVRRRTAHAREVLHAGLTALGLTVVPSVTNFVFVELGPHREQAAALLAADHGILVRDLAAFGAPGCLRVSVGTPAQCERFCAALREVIEVLDGTNDPVGLT
ncbi:histidinol-phosphate transaminase [Streptomyces sp. NPDC000987]|uniref:pyridoxal phosphate-dependent aminotransferase n=1 Tax=Streptomyces sp. NPDC000987 TaxID=3154374 RepID=UPI003327AF46